MDIAQVYVIDADRPSNYMVSGSGDYLKMIYQDYYGTFSHIPFVHHEYAEYWKRGIPVIHVVNNLRISNGRVQEGSEKYLTVFLPKRVSVQNAQALIEKVNELQNGNSKLYRNLVYVKEQTSFGYDYECYPPMYNLGRNIPFCSAIELFLRDSFGEATAEEKKMFEDFRYFDIKKMLTDQGSYSFPVNHNCCGVLVVDRAGERYSSTVTKNGHQETLNYLLSTISEKDMSEEFSSLTQTVIDFSVAILFFKDGELFSYIPECISKSQYDELSNVATEIDDAIDNSNSIVSSARVLLNGELEDNNKTFRENISLSYYEEQKRSRGRVKKRNT